MMQSIDHYYHLNTKRKRIVQLLLFWKIIVRDVIYVHFCFVQTPRMYFSTTHGSVFIKGVGLAQTDIPTLFLTSAT